MIFVQFTFLEGHHNVGAQIITVWTRFSSGNKTCCKNFKYLRPFQISFLLFVIPVNLLLGNFRNLFRKNVSYCIIIVQNIFLCNKTFDIKITAREKHLKSYVLRILSIFSYIKKMQPRIKP